MKASRKTKTAALLLLLGLALLLGGCQVTPDNSGGNTGAGSTERLPFPLLPTATPQPTEMISIITPTPGPVGYNTPFPWVQPTAQPGSYVTPTFSVILPATMVPFETETPSPLATPSALRLGSQGDAVRSLQSGLISLGYLKGTADGDFGKATETALIAFQKRNGLTADGIAGPATLARLNSTAALRPTAAPTPTRRPTNTPYINKNLYLKVGSSGPDVRRMQARLIELGYLAGAPSGHFGEATEAGVIAFQKRNTSYYDGIAGPLTLEKLYSSGARKTSATAGVIGVTLRKGMKDSAAVRAMQGRLKELGYLSGAADGDFGASTESAVKAFQSQHSLKADGVAGESTLNLLFGDKAKKAGSSSSVTVPPSSTPIINYTPVTPHPSGSYITLRPGYSGKPVQDLQKALKNRGYFTGVADGKYGLATEDAVRRFQAAKGLSQDGVAGPATQRILFEGDFPSGS